MLMNIILKLQEHSPVKSVVVRKASCLSPVNMARQSEISVSKFESLVNKLFQGKHLTAKEADGAKSQYDDLSNPLFVKIFQVLRSLIFLMIDLTSSSSHICTETASTKTYGRCVFLFSQRHMGKVLWREASISTNIFWLRISVKPLREVRGWYMIISSHLM